MRLKANEQSDGRVSAPAVSKEITTQRPSNIVYSNGQEEILLHYDPA